MTSVTPAPSKPTLTTKHGAIQTAIVSTAIVSAAELKPTSCDAVKKLRKASFVPPCLPIP